MIYYKHLVLLILFLLPWLFLILRLRVHRFYILMNGMIILLGLIMYAIYLGLFLILSGELRIHYTTVLTILILFIM